MKETYLDTDKYSNYTKAPELYVITVYYNPCNYKSRRKTYDDFMFTMRKSSINVITIECAFGDDKFDLPESNDVVKVRSNSLLWQKERLINIGALYLPNTCKYVAWIDCDIVFENKNWAIETCELLSDKYTIVQLWEECSRLEKENKFTCDNVISFASQTQKDISSIDIGRYDVHGHTGYAWAMRREIFDKLGLYEYAVSGSADHFMAHAIYGKYGFCIENALKHDPKQIKHLKNWGNSFFELTQGKLAAVSGKIYHLWHGSLDKRDYFKRMWKITEYGFNPNTDILSTPGRPLEWRKDVLSEKQNLVSFFAEYFQSREEDK